MTRKTAEHPAAVIRKEGDISLEIRKELDKLGIPNWRMQAGGYRGRARGLKPGTADVLAAPMLTTDWNEGWGMPPRAFQRAVFLWIEVKKPGGKPTTEQKAFADRVIDRGHYWICADSLNDVLKWINENRAR